MSEFEAPKYLYHGTSEEAWRAIQESGMLAPRSDLGAESRWDEHPSGEDRVYLTANYGAYFACGAARAGGNAAILEIEFEGLETENLLPDEDFLEQATRQQYEERGMGDMASRTAVFRDQVDKWQDFWQDSLLGLGSVAYRSKIPLSVINRVAIFDPSFNRWAENRASSPSIIIMNHMFVGKVYNALTRWFFGDPVELRECEYAFDSYPSAQIDKIRAEFANRTGITVETAPWNGGALRGAVAQQE